MDEFDFEQPQVGPLEGWDFTVGNLDIANFCRPAYLAMVTIAIELFIIFAAHGWAGVPTAIWTILFGFLTIYTINCLCQGGCGILAWIWAVLPLIMTVISTMRELRSKYENFDSFPYPDAFDHNSSGIGPCSLEGCKCGCKEGGTCTCGTVDNKLKPDCKGCGCGCGGGFCQTCQGKECCPPGKRNLDPIGSSMERSFYRPREGLNYKAPGASYYYSSE